MECRNCKQEIDANVKYCPHCGSENGVRFCPGCGREVEERFNVCPDCGYVLKRNGLTLSEEETTNGENNGLAVAGFVVALVSLFINFGGLVGLVATVLSAVGLSQIQNGVGVKSKGLAISGLIIGIISILYGLFTLLSL